MSDAPCPCCGGSGRLTEPVDPLAEVRERCRELSVFINDRDEVRSVDAARLIGCTPQWLRTARAYFPDVAPPAVRRGRHCWISLHDLLAYL